MESCTVDGVQILFSVRDTGLGVPPERREAMAAALKQGREPHPGRPDGVGFGLAIASHLVRLMDGTMWFESSEGRGSTFYFTCRFQLQRNPFRTAPATPRPDQFAMLIYMALRNRLDIDTGGGTDFKEIYNDAGVVITKKALTDDGTVYSEAEMETGP